MTSTKERFAKAMAGQVIVSFIEENDITQDNMDEFCDELYAVGREACEMYLSEIGDDSLYDKYDIGNIN